MLSVNACSPTVVLSPHVHTEPYQSSRGSAPHSAGSNIGALRATEGPSPGRHGASPRAQNQPHAARSFGRRQASSYPLLPERRLSQDDWFAWMVGHHSPRERSRFARAGSGSGRYIVGRMRRGRTGPRANPHPTDEPPPDELRHQRRPRRAGAAGGAGRRERRGAGILEARCSSSPTAGGKRSTTTAS